MLGSPKSTTEGYPYSKLSTGGPSFCQTSDLAENLAGGPFNSPKVELVAGENSPGKGEGCQPLFINMGRASSKSDELPTKPCLETGQVNRGCPLGVCPLGWVNVQKEVANRGTPWLPLRSFFLVYVPRLVLNKGDRCHYLKYVCCFQGTNCLLRASYTKIGPPKENPLGVPLVFTAFPRQSRRVQHSHFLLSCSWDYTARRRYQGRER